MVKNYLLTFIFSVFVVFSLFSEERLTFSISPNPVGVNDDFNVIIDVNHPETREVELAKSEYPEGIQLRRGPYVRPATVTTKEGVSKRITRITLTFRSRRSGRIAFEPFNVSIGNETLQTPAFLLEVGTYISRKLVLPLEVEWDTPYDFVYTGEAVPLILKVVRQREIVLFDSITLTPPGGGIFQEYSGVGEISSEVSGATLLYDIPAGFYIFTPTSDSRITIPSAGITYGQSSGESGRKTLQVQTLPEEVSLTGAVGRFELSTRMDIEEIHSQDEAAFYVRIEGLGNLNYLQLPVPEFQGAELLSSYENEKYVSDINGFKGYREAVYIIKIGERESLGIKIPPFPYIERPSGKIIPSQERRLTFPILPAVSEETGMEAEALGPPLLLVPGKPLPEFLDYRKNPDFVIFFIPGPLALILFGLFYKKREDKKKGGRTIFMIIMLISLPLFFSSSRGEEPDAGEMEQLALCQEAYDAGDFDKALLCLNKAVAGQEEGSWLYYSRGLIYAALEEWDLAVLSMNRAIKMESRNSLYRDGWDYINNTGNIDSSYPLILTLDTRYLLISLVILVNFLSILAILYRLYSGAILSILMILSAALIFIILLLSVAAGLSASVPRGVVLSRPAGTETVPVYLKKIPRDEGEDWLQVKPGTVLRIRDRADEYYLIEDGAKISGWLPVNRIKRIGEE